MIRGVGEGEGNLEIQKNPENTERSRERFEETFLSFRREFPKPVSMDRVDLESFFGYSFDQGLRSDLERHYLPPLQENSQGKIQLMLRGRKRKKRTI